MNISESLKNAENSLRDFIGYILQKEKGDNWIENCGVSQNRIKNWKERYETEKKKFQDFALENRLIYYANFYDLKTILKSNWSGEFSTAFGKWKTMEVFLGELEKYRNPEAHKRDLLPYQKHLIIGICEEIRNKIVRYRSLKEEKSSDDFYPRIERISDNLGNVWTPDHNSSLFQSDCKLQVGDKLSFIIAATDPLGEKLNYGINSADSIKQIRWSEENEKDFIITENHIAKNFYIKIFVRSFRKFSAHTNCDDEVAFGYEVLPPH